MKLYHNIRFNLGSLYSSTVSKFSDQKSSSDIRIFIRYSQSNFLMDCVILFSRKVKDPLFIYIVNDLLLHDLTLSTPFILRGSNTLAPIVRSCLLKKF